MFVSKVFASIWQPNIAHLKKESIISLIIYSGIKKKDNFQLFLVNHCLLSFAYSATLGLTGAVPVVFNFLTMFLTVDTDNCRLLR